MNRPLFHALRLPVDLAFFVNLISPVAYKKPNYHPSLRFVGFAPWRLLDDRFRANWATGVNFRGWPISALDRNDDPTPIARSSLGYDS
jgi:hypothetical protein